MIQLRIFRLNFLSFPRLAACNMTLSCAAGQCQWVTGPSQPCDHEGKQHNSVPINLFCSSLSVLYWVSYMILSRLFNWRDQKCILGSSNKRCYYRNLWILSSALCTYFNPWKTRSWCFSVHLWGLMVSFISVFLSFQSQFICLFVSHLACCPTCFNYLSGSGPTQWQ